MKERLKELLLKKGVDMISVGMSSCLRPFWVGAVREAMA